MVTAVGQADTFLAYGADGGRPADCPRSPPAELSGLASLINSNFLIFCMQLIQLGLRKMAIQNVVQLLTHAQIAQWAPFHDALTEFDCANPYNRRYY